MNLSDLSLVSLQIHCWFFFFKLPFSLLGVTVAAKGYFDALVKLGELASDSQGSKELGEWARETRERKEGRKRREEG